MSSGNHLTIRDYFDQLLIARPANRNALSASRSNASESRMFHQILTSHRMQGVGNTDAKSTGLTIADYLANPVRTKCQYKIPQTPISSDKKDTQANTSPGLPSVRSTEAAAGKNTASSQQETKGVQTPRLSASISSQKQTASNERLRIEKSIHKAANKYNLSPNLIKGVIKAESNFQVSAVSHAGAQGLMQLMPTTAKELGVSNPFDIDQNIDGGSRYLRKMLDSFGGDVKLALAAYNAGPGTVRKYDGDVPYQETKHYVSRVLRFSEQTV